MLPQQYKPTLRDIVNLDAIPSSLSFVTEALEKVLSKFYYHSLRKHSSPDGTTVSYNLDIYYYKELQLFEIPGAGMGISLNPPDINDPLAGSKFEVSLFYRWQLLKYLRSPAITSFDFTPKSFLLLIVEMLGLDYENLIVATVQNFHEGQSQDPLDLFVANYNSIYSANISNYEDIHDVLSQIRVERDFLEVLVDNYLSSLDELGTLAKNFLGEVKALDIKDILIPEIAFSINDINLGIKLPRKVFKPVDANNQPIDDPEKSSYIIFHAGSLHFSTFEGLIFDKAAAFDFQRSEILDSGIIIEIQKLKLDLSEKTNIPEADLDGRTPDFKGFFVEAATFSLPPKWFKQENGQTLAITGERLLIGTGGLSGTLALRASQATNDQGEVTDYYSRYFQLNYPVTVVGNSGDHNIVSHEGLVAHINSLENRHQLKFKYPIEVFTNETLTFENETVYQDFLRQINPDDFLWFKLGKDPGKAWRVGFNRFDLSFSQGQVIESNLKARLEVPRRNADGNAVIDLEGHWQSVDDFSLSASFLPNGIPLKLFGLVNINFLTVELGREDEKFFLGTSCEIWFENEQMQKMLQGQRIQIPKMRIYEDGRFEIVGGNSFIPVDIPIKLGPAIVSVTGIHFGSMQREHKGVMRKYNYFGLDGAISVNPLKLDARGEGLKFYYTTDNDEHGGDKHSFLHIQTIEVEFVVPPNADPGDIVAEIQGKLSIPEPGGSKEFMGEVSVNVPKKGIAGKATMRLNPRYPSFLTDMSVDLPAPIPIGPLGIYGFRGMIGFRYVAEKEAIGLESGKDTWYDYFVHPPRGIHPSKFVGPEHTKDYNFPFSYGAGMVLGTSFDNGISISMRTMNVISLPRLFLIQGKASLISARLGLTDSKEPPFFAFIAWGDQSIEIGMLADLKIPEDTGLLLEMNSNTQARFPFKNPSSWYINAGTPEEPNISRSLQLFTTKSYLNLSAQGIKMGFGAEVEQHNQFGPAKVHLLAYAKMGGQVSFERFQLGGFIELGGIAHVDIWIIAASVELNARLSAEAPQPYLLEAELRLQACAKLFFKKKVCKNFTIPLRWEKSKTVNRTPIAPLPHANSSQPDRTQELVKGIHMLTNESFALNFLGLNLSSEPTISQITEVLPLDTYIDIKTVKGLIPGGITEKIGGHTGAAAGYTDLIPPQRVVAGREIRQVKHKYSIESIEIKAWNGSSWIDYHPFAALVEAGTERSKVEGLKIGYWQRSGEQYNTIRLLATTPFSFTAAGVPGNFVPEQYGITPSELFCESTPKDFECTNVLNKDIGTIYHPPTQYLAHEINGAYFTLEGEYYMTIDQNPDGSQHISESKDYFEVTNAGNSFKYTRSLSFDHENSLVIILPEPATSARLKLNTETQGATITYYRSSGVQDYNTVYESIQATYKTANELYQEVVFESTTNALISKIVIKPGAIPSFNVEENLGADNINTYPTHLQEVCWMSLENFEYNQTIPGQAEVEAEQTAMQEGNEKTIQPIWRPNTHYYIRFKLKDEVDNGANIGTFDYCYGFKTAGPVGHFHNANGVNYGNEYDAQGQVTNRQPDGTLTNPDQYPLTSLRPYIDYQRSYPQANGNLLQAKPLFYGNKQCKINLYFSKALAYHMLSGWPAYGPHGSLPAIAGALNLAIKDPVSNVIIPYPLPANYHESVPDVEAQDGNTDTWQSDDDPRIPLDLQTINDMISHVQANNETIKCQLVLGGPITPASKTYAVALANLKPQKLYTALVYNAFDNNGSNTLEEIENTQVHEYVFQTSRYAHFREQVKSYVLEEEVDEQGNVVKQHQAVFDLSLSLGTEQEASEAINTAYALTNQDATAGADHLATQYPHLFDRALVGVLGIQPMDSPETTEFNVIKNADTGEVIALLIRNPEPFNIPKIPVEEVNDTIEVMLNTGAKDEHYVVLHSKDYSQALVMHNSKKITAHSLNFKFRYKTWNGSAYVANDQDNLNTIDVNNIQINQ